MSTGAAKHSSLPYETPGAEQTHIHTAKQGEVAHPLRGEGGCVCVCVYVCVWGGGRMGRDRGGPLFQTGRQKCWEGARESQGEAKFRAPPLKYSKYSYVYLDAHVYSLLLHPFPRVASLCSNDPIVTDLNLCPLHAD